MSYCTKQHYPWSQNTSGLTVILSDDLRELYVLEMPIKSLVLDEIRHIQGSMVIDEIYQN